jgi:ABC-type spermidine/putrescine transport system permease subunit I
MSRVLPDPATAGRRLGRRGRRRQSLELQRRVWYPRGFWPSFAAPGSLWLLALFVVPFYTILCVAFGTVDPIFQSPVPIWNPLQWQATSMVFVLQQTFLQGGIYQPAFVRTVEYVGIALGLCLVIGYPVAYFVARYGGRFKAVLLLAMIAPFWISYLMRMLAWLNLLQDDGLVNKTLLWLNVIAQPHNWLNGQPSTVVLGLAYGYIPYMILPLFGALDRIDHSMLEAARDLGASPGRTFVRVTLPMSRQAILAGAIITALPMFGDYYTQDLLSASPRTTMVGNLVDQALNSPFVGRAAALTVLLMALLLLPMLYYLYATSRAARERA